MFKRQTRIVCLNIIVPFASLADVLSLEMSRAHFYRAAPAPHRQGSVRTAKYLQTLHCTA